MKKDRKCIAAAALAALVFALSAVTVQAGEPSRDRDRGVIKSDRDRIQLDREDLIALRALESLKSLKIRVRGLRDIRVDVDLRGLRSSLRKLERLGNRIEKRVDRDVRRMSSRDLRGLKRALKRLDLDLDFDFDFDFDFDGRRDRR